MIVVTSDAIKRIPNKVVYHCIYYILFIASDVMCHQFVLSNALKLFNALVFFRKKLFKGSS